MYGDKTSVLCFRFHRCSLQFDTLGEKDELRALCSDFHRAVHKRIRKAAYFISFSNDNFDKVKIECHLYRHSGAVDGGGGREDFLGRARQVLQQRENRLTNPGRPQYRNKETFDRDYRYWVLQDAGG